MPGHDVIVIGASAGGIEALKALVKLLADDLPASLFITLHVPGNGTSVLPKILSRVAPFAAHHPEDMEAIEHGRIYIAPPDTHLLVKRGHVRLTRGPKENGFRPAIDPMFRTAARYYGHRVVGVILSGTLDDGTAGMIAIKKQGGIAIAQDPDEALYNGMPLSAIENAGVDYVAPLSEIASILIRLANEPIEEGEEPVSDDMELESDISELEFDSLHRDRRPGSPSRFSCPECNGVLWEIDDENLLRFRCRVGHAYSAETLLAEQSDAVEAAMWAALRALEENVALMSRLADRMRRRGHEKTAERFEAQARDADNRAEVLRQTLITRPALDPAEPDPQRADLPGSEAQLKAEALPAQGGGQAGND
ncbi:MAG TPA: chemotaxis protein CheB [Blastocatellia bacterium]|nr:chemotaxis protein CheB [Blastocatellia bacterium]